jgi:TatA/E family protein of Tat protein translocase
MHNVVPGQKAGCETLRHREKYMGELLTPSHLIVAVVAFVLFGGKRLAELGKGLGEGIRGLKEGTQGNNWRYQ